MKSQIELTTDMVEGLASTARAVDKDFRDPMLNPHLPRPIPSAVVTAWTAYRKLLKKLIALQAPLDPRPRSGPSPASLLTAFCTVEKAMGNDRHLLAVIRFHGAVLRMAIKPDSRRFYLNTYGMTKIDKQLKKTMTKTLADAAAHLAPTQPLGVQKSAALSCEIAALTLLRLEKKYGSH